MITPQEYEEALRVLSVKINESHNLALDARDKLGSLITKSNLQSTITLLREDIGLRRAMEMNYHR